MNHINESDNREELLKEIASRRWDVGDNFHDRIMESIYQDAQQIADNVVIKKEGARKRSWDQILDKLVTGKWTGFPIMFLFLAAIFWITITGANIPSDFLSKILVTNLHPILKNLGVLIGLPWWLNGFVFDGMYLGMAWVISVMLPPMAIFFPLFTLMEDFGYLPRVAFNLDFLFQKAGAHGKQALTMAMGYGCNVAGVIATRVIDSPRERLIAILTNNFSICNGRWPLQILIATIFIGSLVPPHLASAVAALSVVAVVLIGIFFMFAVSFGLSRTILRGEASSFHLELPPYRPPRILQTLFTSIIDRTLIVLWRAIVWAVPSGAVIWLVGNISIGGKSLAEYLINFIDPVGLFVGLNGIILLAYIIAIPANEIVIPTILMLTVITAKVAGVDHQAGVLMNATSIETTRSILTAGGWTILTGINIMLFSLLHNPCSTTLYTIYKETGSAKWTFLSAAIPLALGFIVCFIITMLWKAIFG